VSDQRTTLVDTIDGARMSAHRLFAGAVLVGDGAVIGITTVLLDDAQASTELLCAEDWLLSSAHNLPHGMATVALLHVLSMSPTLGEIQ
jgi:hypothetical protein